ncbi:putative repeat protein (TIGR01451 family) [Aquimarina sp. MAR_2010_214]|uniref:T9SS type B sorting domain-containing protein n=1 Tax=Aquimarina sp. MAR_2010_214 TaxID=1250026 RepID=UPI000C70D33A|nr:gliding motility-associated C-terminal domain-containing protein [Aquimarina sp. MAR_2010_214]PKV48068.1 putative repeat protein (TIGR01451 family) [Aquimarina sp. MAR_2010_214]
MKVFTNFPFCIMKLKSSFIQYTSIFCFLFFVFNPIGQLVAAYNGVKILTSDLYGEETAINSENITKYESVDLLSKHTNIYIDTSVKDSYIIQEKLLEEEKEQHSILHFFSHARPGEVLIKGKWYNSLQLASWLRSSKRLETKTHINIYGCEFAKGEKGLEAVSYLEKELGITVSASNNVTGKDGDWILEVGNVNNSIQLDKYNYNLQDSDAIPNNLDLDDDNDGILDTDEGLCYPAEINHIGNTNNVSLSVFDTSNNTDYTQLQTVQGQPSPLNPEIFINGFDSAGGRGIFSFTYTNPKTIPIDANGQLNLSFHQYNNIANTSGGYVSTPRNVNIFTDQGTLSGTWIISTAQATILDAGGWVQQTVSFAVTPNSNLEITGLEIDMEANTGGTASTTFFPGTSEVYALAIEPLSGCSASVDTDNDSIPDHLDVDSDNDGIYDVVESGGTPSITNLGEADGAVGTTPTTNGVPSTAGTGNTPTNTVGTSPADYLNTDSDGDACNDANEAYNTSYANYVSSPTDSNADGTYGGVVNNTGVTTNGAITGLTYTTDATRLGNITNSTNSVCLLDSDGDGIADTADLDDDNDGILDTDECNLVSLNINWADLGLTDAGISAAGGQTIADIGAALSIPALNGVGVTVRFTTTGATTPTSNLINGAGSPWLTVANAIGGTRNVEVSFTRSFEKIMLMYDGGFSDGESVSYTPSGGVLLQPTPPISGLNITGQSVTNPVGGTGLITVDFPQYEITNGATMTVSSTILSGGLASTGQNGVLLRIRYRICDTDGDGVENRLDVDSDNDGIYDVVESGGTPSTTNLGQADGVVGTSPTTNGVPSTAGTGNTPTNTVGTSPADYINTDSDGDSCNDANEAYNTSYANYVSSPTDSNADGTYGGVVNNTGVTTNGAITGLTYTTDATRLGNVINSTNSVCLLDSDGDGILDTADLDDDNDGVLDTDECNLVSLNINWADLGLTDAGISAAGGQTIADIGAALSIPALNGVGVTVRFTTTGATTPTSNLINGAGSPWLTVANAVGGTRNVEVSFTRSFEKIMLMYDGGFSDGESVSYTPSGGVLLQPTPPISGLNITGQSVTNPVGGTGLITVDFPQYEITNGATMTVSSTILSGGLASTGQNGVLLRIRYRICDADGDGVENRLDVDSDNDGIYDVVESGGTPSTTNLGQADGAVGTTPTTNGIPSTAGTGNTPTNTVGTSPADYINTDSDGDACNDANEAYNTSYANYISSPTDSNADGTYGGVVNNTGVTTNGAITGLTYTTDAPRLGNVINSTANVCSLDGDGDGVLTSVEDAGPNGGDGNNDGILDSQQNGVASILDATGGGYVTLSVTGDCGGITSVSSMFESSLSDQDLLFEYPVGLVDFKLACGGIGQSGDIKYYWHSLSTINTYRKYGPLTAGGTVKSYRNYTVTSGTEVIGGATVPTVEYTLTDGVDGQDDSIGDSEIIDPTGPAVAATDSDGDGVVDTADLDDDNDGILDTVECGVLASLNINWADLGLTDAGVSAVGGQTIADIGAALSIPALNGIGVTVRFTTTGATTPTSNLINGVGSPWLGLANAVGGTRNLEVSFTRSFEKISLMYDGNFSDGESVSFTPSGGVLLQPTPPISGINITGQSVTNPVGGLGNILTAFPRYEITNGSTMTVSSTILPGGLASTGQNGVLLNIRYRICDTDGDGVENRLDVDSDNDGIYDVVESGGTPSTTNLGQADGVVGTSPTTNGVPSTASTGNTPTNTVGTSPADYINTDSDGDACNDANEAYNTSHTDYVSSPTDSNSDGTYGGVVDNTGVTTNGAITGLTYTTDATRLGNVINNSTVSVCELDSDGDGIADTADLDDDNDGVLDIEENCEGFKAQNSSGAWIGSTTSTATYTLPGFASQTNTMNVSDGQTPYYINDNGAGTRVAISGDAIYTVTFSPGIPANEIAFYINDFDGVNSPGGSYTVTVNGGSVPVNLFRRAELFSNRMNYNTSTGLISSLGDVINNQTIMLVGNSSTLITELVVTSSNVGSGDTVAYSIFGGVICDADNDGISNQLDVDSDNDGIYDVVESGGTPSTTNLGEADGAVGTTPTTNGVPSTAGTGNTPTNTVGTSPADYINTDSDGDACNDANEAYNTSYANYVSSPTDANADGTYGGVVNNTGVTTNGAITGLTYTTDATRLGNVINNSTVSVCELDSDGDGIADTTDLDDDNDGVLDDTECVLFSLVNWNDIGLTDGGISAPGGQTIADIGAATGYFELNGISMTVEYTATAQINTSNLVGGAGSPWLEIANDPGGTRTVKITFSAPLEEVTIFYDGQFTDGESVSFSPSSGTLSNPPATTGLILTSTSVTNPVGGTGTVTGPLATYTVNNSNTISFTSSILAGGANTTSQNGVSFRIKHRSCDTDGDGIVNHLDVDSDNDGIYDVVESGGTPSTINLGQADGAIGTTPTTNGIPSTAGTGNIPTNTVGTSPADYINTDSDGDACNDANEAYNTSYANYVSSPTDSNADGTYGGVVNNTGVTTNGAITGLTYTTDATRLGNVTNSTATICVLDSDGDGIPDTADLDDDNDGILDTVECGVLASLNINWADLGLTDAGVSAVGGQTIADIGAALSIPALNGIGVTVRFTTTGATTPTSNLINGVGSPWLALANAVGGTRSVEVSFTRSFEKISLMYDGNFSDGESVSYTPSGGVLLQPTGPVSGLNITGQSVTNPVGGLGNILTAFPRYEITNGARMTISSTILSGGLASTGQNGILLNIRYRICDTDGDGVENRLDVDSDNDGIYDVVESGGTPSTTNLGQADGAVGTSPTTNGVPSTAGTGNTPTNTVGTSPADYINTDSDGDACNDANEAYNTDYTDFSTSPIDSNNDGTYGGVVDNTGVTTNGAITGLTYTTDATQLGNITNSTANVCSLDGDGDGVLTSVEDAGPNGGDGNNDGILDSQQNGVATLLDATGGGYVTLSAAGDCGTISSVNTMFESSLSDQDLLFEYPVGLVEFKLACGAIGQSGDVKYYWHGLSTYDTYRKYGPLTAGGTVKSYRNYTVTSGAEVIGGASVPTVEYTLTDGVDGQDDSIGDSEIIDPTGPAVSAINSDSDGIPDSADLDDDNDGIADDIECAIFSIINWNDIGLTNMGISTPGGQTIADLGAATGFIDLNGISMTVEYTLTGPSTPVSNLIGGPGNPFLSVANAIGSMRTINITFSAAMEEVTVFYDGQFTDGEVVNFTPVGGVLSDPPANPGLLITSNGVLNMVGGTANIFGPQATYTVNNSNTVSILSSIVSGGAATTSMNGIVLRIKHRSCDTDGDGIVNHLDVDSDNDGIYDVVESGGTPSTTNLGEADGAVGTTPTTNGIPSTAGTGNTPTNTIGTSPEDYVNTDSDGDGCNDANEAYNTSYANYVSSPTDSNADGTYGGVVDNAGVTTNGAITGLTYTTDATRLSNVINNSTVSVCELDSDGDGIVDTADLDDDNDGILDTDEIGCSTLPNTFDYSVHYSDEQDPTLSTSTENGVTFTFSRTSTAGAGVTDANIETSSTYSGFTNFWNFSQEPNSISDNTVATIGFSKPLLVSFSLLDVDANTGWADKITVNGYINGSLVTLTASDFTLNATYTQYNGLNEFEGIGNTSVDGNVQITFPVLVDTIEIIYSDSIVPTGSQRIGVSSLNYCIPKDTDQDGILDYLDIDSDNDGIYDVVESGGTPSATNLGQANGAVGTTPTTNGVPSTAGTGNTPTNTVGTSPADYINTDSDGDGCNDANEAYNTSYTDYLSSPADSNSDGTYGGVVNNAGVTTNGAITGLTYTTDATRLGNVTNNTANVCVASNDIVTVKTNGSTTFAPGTTVAYTITMTNNGPSVAPSVTVADTAPAGTTISSWTAVVTSGTATLPNASGSGNLNETLTNMSNGGVVTYTVNVDVPASFTGALSNTATVTSPTDPDPSCTSCTDGPDTNTPSNDIVTVKTNGSTTFAPGTTVAYTITMTNNGPSVAPSVTVADTAPAGTTISSWTAAVSSGTATLPNASGSGDLNETVTNMSNGGVVTYTVNVDVPASFTGALSNTATVTSPTDPDPSCTSCTDGPDTNTPSNDIITVKTNSSTTFAPGTTVAYTITMINSGPSMAPSVTVADTAPAGTTISSWTVAVSSGTATLPNASGSGDLNETVTNMSNGGVVTYTVNVDVPASFTGALSNTATVTSPTDPDPSCTSCTDGPDTNTPSNDIVTVKTNGSGTITPGTTVAYTITMTNNGPSVAPSVTVADTAPAGTTISSWTAVVTSGTATLPNASGSGDLNETLTNMSNGGVVTYTVNVDVPASFTGALSNTATVTSPTDPDPSCTSCTDGPDTNTPSNDIVTVKTNGSTTFAPGTTVAYTITMTNNGPSMAPSVTVADTAPAGTTITSWTAVVTSGTAILPNASGSGDLNETLTNMSNGGVVTYTVNVDVPASFTGALSNTATVTSPTDPDPSCTSCTDGPDTNTPSNDIVTVKTNGSTTFAPGTTVAYTITMTNNGPSMAPSVTVADTAPAGTTISSWTAVVTSGTATLPNASGSGDLNETLTNMSNGGVVTYTVNVDVPASFTGALSNTATVTSPTDPDPSCTSCTDGPDTNTPSNDIVTVKTNGSTTFAPGTTVAYTITMTNNGPSMAPSVTVADTAPAGTTISSWTAVVTSGTATLPNASGSGDLNETLTNMSNGGVVTYTVNVDVPASFTGALSNTATVTSPTDPDPSCTSCTDGPDTNTPSNDIVTVKTNGSTTFAPGTTVAYTITMTNNGPSMAPSVTVADTAPAGTTISSWTAVVTSGTATLPNASGSGDLNETVTNMSNGGVVTYTVNVDVPASFTGTLSNTATVTSPTDPDPSCTSCTDGPDTNTPSNDIVTVKTNGSTTFAPGTTVAYTITMTNNGPSMAPSVTVADTAPAGTTISSWTAVVTSGTATLPNASGSGDLNETVTNMSNGGVVTYTVNVDVPASFTGALSNTATVTSPTDPDPSCTSCTDGPDTNTPSNDIVTVKTNGSTTFAPGTTVAYTITMTNNGPSMAPSVTVADTAPAGTTISSWTAAVTSGTATLPNASGSGDLNETVTNMSNGGVVTYTVNVDVPASFTGTLSNTATVTSPTDPDPSCTSCTDGPDTNTPSNDIVTVKTNGSTTFAPGTTVAYTITMTNNGPSMAPSVTVADTAPAGTTISSWTAVVTSGTATLPNASGSGDLNETLTNMSNGGVVTYTVNVDVPASFTGALSNTATVTSPTDPDPSCTSCTDGPDTNTPSNDIVTVKTNGSTTFAPGTTVAYTITMTNNGPSMAPSVTVADTAPAGTTISSWTAVVTSGTATLPNASGSGDLNETLTNMSNGGVVTYTVNVDVPASFTGTLSNTATVTSPTDPDPSCTSCTDGPDTNTPSNDIVTVKTNGSTTFAPGTTVAYTITMTNNGPSMAPSVTVADTAPAGTTISSWTAVVTSGTATLPNASGSGDLNETLTNMSNGGVVTYTVNVDVPASFTGALSNTATVTSPTDPDPSCTSCTDGPDTNTPSNDIVTVKTNGSTTFAPGTTVAYTITMTNNGPSMAPSVTVADTAPAGTTISSWTAVVTSGTATLPNASGSGDLNETLTNMSNGGVVTYTVNVDVPASFTGALSNTATVTSPTDPDPSCTSCTDGPDTNTPSNDIVTVKTNGSTTFAPGTTVAYTITMTNNGPSMAPSVTVADTAPAGTTISSWTAVVTSGTATLPNASGSGDLNETVTNMSNGGVVTYTVNVDVPASFTGTLSNTATVTSPTDPDPSCTSCTDGPDTNTPSNDIVTVKTNGSTTFAPGTTVAYTITMTNNGPSMAPSVTVADTAPAGTTISSWTAVVTSGTATLPNASGSGDLNETVTNMSNGGVVTYTVNVDVPASFTGALSNTATVTSPTDPDPSCTSCTDGPDTNTPSNDIVTVKTNGSTTFAPGTTVAYTITMTNNGPSMAPSVTVADTAPAGTTISSWTAAVTSGTATLPNASGSGDLNETVTNMSNGGVVTYTVNVDVPASFTGTLSNTATVTSPTDPDPSCTSCTDGPDTNTPSNDIVTVKTNGSTTFAPGTTVAYTITMTNNGPSMAPSVTVADTAPAGTTISSWTAVVTSGTATLPNASGSGDLNETLTNMSNGGVVTYTVNVDVPASFTGALSNTATVTSPTDPDPSCTSCTDGPDTNTPSNDIVTVKTNGSTTFAPGTTVAYTITMTNNGPSMAPSVTVADTAPAGTTISSWTAAVTSGTATLPNASGSGDLNETLTNMSNGGVVTYTVNVDVPASFTGTLSNTATVTSPTDPDPSCTSCTDGPDTNTPSNDIVTVKTNGSTTFAPGTTVAYTITMTNNGPSMAPSVTVADTAPAGTTISSWTAAVTSGTATLPNASGSGDLNETVTNMSNGGVVTYTVNVDVPASFTGTLSNTATVTSPTDPDPSCTSCTDGPDTNTPSNDIVTVKTNGSTTFAPGTTVAYTITMTNNGPSMAPSVTVADTAPAGTTISSWTAVVTSGTATLPNASGSGDLNETLTNMSNGGVVTYTVNVDVPASFTGALSNTATVTSPTDPDPSCTSCTDGPDTNTPSNDIVTVKTNGSTTFAPGTTVAYTITMTNNGPSMAPSVTVADTAPAGTTISSWTAVVTSGTATLPNASGSGDLNETLTNMSNGGVVTYTVNVDVPASFTGTLSNTATVTSPTDPDPSCTSCTDGPDTNTPSNDIVTVKTNGSTTFAPGTTVAYTITMTNNGPSMAPSVTVADTAPAGTTISSWTAAVTSGTATLPNASGSGDLNETLTNMSNGGVVTYTVNVDVPASFTGALSNTATVTSPTDPDPSCTSCTDGPDTNTPSNDIVTVKTNGSTTFAPGTTVAYTITMTNNGPSMAPSVTVADTAPAGTTISSWTAAVTSGTATLPNASGSGDLNETLTNMSNGGVVTYTVNVDVPASFTGTLSNTATVTSPTDPDPSCTSCTDGPDMISGADIITTKTSLNNYYTGNEQVVYLITVKNDGPIDAQNVNVVDVAPSNTSIVSWQNSLGDTGTGNLNHTLPILANGATVVYTVVVSIDSNFADAELINTAIVTSSTFDPNPDCTACTHISIIDTDGDGVTNGQEIADGTNPIDVCDYNAENQILANVSENWNTMDCDGDGVNNAQEIEDGTAPEDGCSFDLNNQNINIVSSQWMALDCDNDGVINEEEIDPDGDGQGPDDTDGDGIPDILDDDDDDDGIPTSEENADPNGDGNPDDAIDTDGNGIPDYLEPNEPTGEGEDGIIIFTGISPNGDGINDVFVISGIENLENRVSIYNRWGVKVFGVKNYGRDDNFFRGFSTGRSTIEDTDQLPVGTYYYVLEYVLESGEQKNRAGYLYINR